VLLTIPNPNFVNITGNFSLAVTGTVNGDSGIVKFLVMLKERSCANSSSANCNALANFNKEITSNSEVIQVYFIHDGQV
jgi:hypothetical protein